MKLRKKEFGHEKCYLTAVNEKKASKKCRAVGKREVFKTLAMKASYDSIETKIMAYDNLYCKIKAKG